MSRARILKNETDEATKRILGKELYRKMIMMTILYVWIALEGVSG